MSTPDYHALFAALDRFLMVETNHESTLQSQAEAEPEDLEACYCGYIDPGFPGDPKCVNCERKERVKKEKLAADLCAAADKELSLPEGDPARIFTGAEIRDVRGVHCDKRGFNRLLLRELRKRLGVAY